MCLNIAYIAENNKKNKKSYCLSFGYCSYAWLHCSCPMNNAIGASYKNLKKKVENTNAKAGDVDTQIKRTLYVKIYINR